MDLNGITLSTNYITPITTNLFPLKKQPIYFSKPKASLLKLFFIAYNVLSNNKHLKSKIKFVSAYSIAYNVFLEGSFIITNHCQEEFLH